MQVVVQSLQSMHFLLSMTALPNRTSIALTGQAFTQSPQPVQSIRETLGLFWIAANKSENATSIMTVIITIRLMNILVLIVIGYNARADGVVRAIRIAIAARDAEIGIDRLV